MIFDYGSKAFSEAKIVEEIFRSSLPERSLCLLSFIHIFVVSLLQSFGYISNNDKSLFVTIKIAI